MEKFAKGLAFFALMALSAFASAQQIHKWKDAEGRTHYSSEPPPKDAQIEQIEKRVTEISSAASAAQSKKIVLYTTRSCGYCKQAKAYLNRRGLSYTERDIEQSTVAAQEFRQLGGRGVPLILVGEQRMQGYSQDGLEAMLR